MAMAFSPEEQARLTVTPEVVTGSPASSAAARPTLPLAATQPAALRDRLLAQLKDVMGNAQFSDDRLAQEVALLATRADVREELDRLNAHVQEARVLLASGEPVGRKIDFLAQEFNREANTLGSKSVDSRTTQASVELKVLIEQMREQVQNIE